MKAIGGSFYWLGVIISESYRVSGELEKILLIISQGSCKELVTGYFCPMFK